METPTTTPTRIPLNASSTLPAIIPAIFGPSDTSHSTSCKGTIAHPTVTHKEVKVCVVATSRSSERVKTYKQRRAAESERPTAITSSPLIHYARAKPKTKPSSSALMAQRRQNKIIMAITIHNLLLSEITMAGYFVLAMLSHQSGIGSV